MTEVYLADNSAVKCHHTAQAILQLIWLMFIYKQLMTGPYSLRQDAIIPAAHGKIWFDIVSRHRIGCRI